MSGFTKLHSSLLTSTVWREDPATKVVWITFLAMADIDGVVEASLPGLAAVANVTLAEAEAAVARFLAPDKYSRTPDNEGRRIEAIDGGWRLLNYDKYRDKSSAEELRAKATKRQQRWRNSRNATSVTPRDKASRERDSDVLSCVSHQAEAEAEEKNKPSSSENNEPLTVRYEADVDGADLFEKACSAYPKPERDYATQTQYFEAVGRIRGARQCSDAEAAGWLQSRIVLYSQRTNPTFAVGFEKFLRKEIYAQPESAWGSADAADVPIRKTTSLPLSQRMAQEAAYGN
jgi:hypothetical protein